MGLAGGEALSVDQVKKAEPGSPSNVEMEFGMARSSNFEVLSCNHVNNDIALQPAQWHRIVLRRL